jgi:hypothetical protein
MGFYINPPNGEAKSVFLERVGQRIPPPTAKFHYSDVPNDVAIVCLVSNGSWDAAGIAYSEEELHRFAYPGDRRPRKWYLIPRDRAIAACEDLTAEEFE